MQHHMMKKCGSGVGGRHTCSALITLNEKARRSMGMAFCLAWFWSTAVRNPCGKKNPGSQKARGSPLCSQASMKSIRALKLDTHCPSGLSDG